MPYLSLAELLENSERLHELPLFAIQETDESIRTPLCTHRVSAQSTARGQALRRQSEGLAQGGSPRQAEHRGEGDSGRAGSIARAPENELASQRESSGSFFKITSITQNQIGSAESKQQMTGGARSEHLKGNVSPSKKSHFSPENNKLLEQFPEPGAAFEGRSGSLRPAGKENLEIRQELTRQSIQIEQMAKMQHEILETLRRQSQAPPRLEPKSRKVPKSQFMSIGERPGGGLARDSGNVLMDSAHFNLAKSQAGPEEHNSLEQAKFSVFNIFQKRSSDETQRSQEPFGGRGRAAPAESRKAS